MFTMYTVYTPDFELPTHQWYMFDLHQNIPLLLVEIEVRIKVRMDRHVKKEYVKS